MAGYCSSMIVYYFIYIFNFCENTYNSVQRYISSTINNQLEGRVLYYAMYTKGKQGNYYTQLYDMTSLFNRLKLIILNIIYHDYYASNSIFTYTEVYTNIENLTSFMIDAVIVSYINNGHLETKILSYKEEDYNDDSTDTATSRCPKFVYALVVSQNEGVEKEYDFTKELNKHITDIKNSPLVISDFIYIIKSKYKKEMGDDDNYKLKTMMDNDFNEVFYNNNDKLEI